MRFSPRKTPPALIPQHRREPEPVLARIARGDAAALTRCIEDYGALVAAIARRLSPTAADAEDATQDAIFLDVLRSASRYNPALGSEKVFITTIARRRLIDRLRRSPSRFEMVPAARSTSLAPTMPASRRTCRPRRSSLRARSAGSGPSSAA